METYKEFLDRINSFEKSEIDLGDKYFKGSGSIDLKVDENNGFKPFFGDTVVFNLDDNTKKHQQRLQTVYMLLHLSAFVNDWSKTHFI